MQTVVRRPLVPRSVVIEKFVVSSIANRLAGMWGIDFLCAVVFV